MSNLTANQLIDRYAELAKRRGELLVKITKGINASHNDQTLSASDGHTSSASLTQKDSLLVQAHGFWTKANEESRQAPSILRKNPITMEDLQQAERLIDAAKQHLTDADAKLTEALNVSDAKPAAQPEEKQSEATQKPAPTEAPKPAAPKPAPQTKAHPVIEEQAPAQASPGADPHPLTSQDVDRIVRQHIEAYAQSQQQHAANSGDLPHDVLEALWEASGRDLRTALKFAHGVNKSVDSVKSKQYRLGIGKHKNSAHEPHQDEYPEAASHEHASNH
jgi:pyruvate/2-oxoglutarate dehydrogenase complex dihydrolipoamide acyltransferase (E2) component